MVELVKQGLQLPFSLAKLQARLAIQEAVYSAQFPEHLQVCGRQRPVDFLDFVAGKPQNHSLVQSFPIQDGAPGGYQE